VVVGEMRPSVSQRRTRHLRRFGHSREPILR
jgi:hypothetical protein